jgi:L,D-transpeptidase-like protein/sporulation and spore germination protein/putative peptidoglycan binding protein
VRRFLPAALALAIVLLLAGQAAGQSTLKVWFLQGEQMVSVDRPGTSAEDAVQALLAGPTSTERKLGFRTYIPFTTELNDVSVANGLATVDLSLDFALGGDAPGLTARVSQLVHTLVGIDGATRVQLLIEGGVALGMFPGIVTSQPITLKYLETPNVPALKTPPPKAVENLPPVAGLRVQQQQLAKLGFLLPSDVDGVDGPETQTAVLAFQKWEGLGRDGVLGPITKARLKAAAPPRPVTQGPPGKRAEVLLDRQVLLAIQDNKVVRVLPVSTGKPTTPTPPGDFHIYARIAKWWSVPFREWLLWAVPFNGGIAFHEFSEVPPYAASHGCVRELSTTSKWMYDFSVVGMPVKVIARSV